MIIKTTSKVYDEAGNVIASYSNAETITQEDLERHMEEFANIDESKQNEAMPQKSTRMEETKEAEPECDFSPDDCNCPYDCPGNLDDFIDDLLDDDEDECDGEDVFFFEIKLDTIKKISAAAGCAIALGLARKIIKGIF